MKKFSAALAAIALTLGVVCVGVVTAAPASAVPTVTTTVQTSTVIAQFPDPGGAWIYGVAGALARMFPDGNVGGGVVIIQFGGSSSPSGATYRGFSIVYPNGYTITYRYDSDLEGGVTRVIITY